MEDLIAALGRRAGVKAFDRVDPGEGDRELRQRNRGSSYLLSIGSPSPGFHLRMFKSCS